MHPASESTVLSLQGVTRSGVARPLSRAYCSRATGMNNVMATTTNASLQKTSVPRKPRRAKRCIPGKGIREPSATVAAVGALCLRELAHGRLVAAPAEDHDEEEGKRQRERSRSGQGSEKRQRDDFGHMHVREMHPANQRRSSDPRCLRRNAATQRCCSR